MSDDKTSLPSTNLAEVIDVLEELRSEGIISDFAIGGAVAAILHYEPFSTIDLDIFFLLANSSEGLVLDLSKIYDFAREKGFSFEHEYINIHGWPVQFVEASHSPLWTEAIKTAELMPVDDVRVKVIDPEHLAAMWIFAGRKKDIRKIEMFDEAGIMNSETLSAVLLNHNLLELWKLAQHNFSDEYQF